MTEKSTQLGADREDGAKTETPLRTAKPEKFTPESSRERETE
ncbi:MAG: hypothetical protein ACK2TT_00495 [Anaerolineales bacterium]